MFKVTRSNIQIAITGPQIAQLRSNLVQSFIKSQTVRWYIKKVQGQRSKVKVTGSKFKVTV